MNDADANSNGWAAPGGSPSAPPSPPAAPPGPTAAPSPLPAVGPSVVHAAPPRPTAPTYRSWQPGLIPLRPQTFGDFITVPFKAMRYNRAVVIGGPMLFILVAMVLTGGALWLLFTDPRLALFDPTSQLGGIQPSTVAVSALAVVGLICADVYSSAVVAPGFARAVLGERIALGEALTIVRSRAWALLGLYGITLVAGTLALAPGVLVVLVGVTADDTASVVIGVIVAVAMGLTFGLLGGVLTGAARAVVVLERIGPIAALRRIVTVIRGRFWWSVLIVFVTGTIINIAVGAVQQVASFPIAFLGALAPNQEVLWLVVMVIATVLITLVGYVVLYSYMGGVYTLIYVDVRIRHEGFDLDLARAAEARRT